ncbi:BTAD domain-containing putative transcriptional regulator [Klenkia brasiliensis]|uniref:Predicted ATPase n=1 Tax=Klenkia brasiliensis TaxID=333142 RepID=A0A1G7T9F9_9ACTN|nr:BTAD domain-containing putative transcriptional regulator [Klenkia brasiliensis]SDG31936.1 Predicted ATPase [Klenkia brasiliensis]
MTVAVQLLGPVAVLVDGRPVELGGQRARALVARLALDPGRVVPVDALVDALWETDPPAAPANALQAVVSRLRRAVPALPVRSQPPGYLLDLPRDAVDACLLEDGADPGSAGEPLADLRDLGFTEAPAARWSELQLAAAERRLAGTGADGLPELDRLVAAHPLRETLAAVRVRALHRAGRTADALAAYAAARARLADELGLDPGPALREAHLAVLRDEAPPAPERPVLRTPLTSFRGRDAELDLVSDRLTGGRLVTLIGPGGAGKTRLALESARRREGQLPDGVWWVELAPVTEARQLPGAVLAAVGRRETGLLDRVPTAPEAGERLREVFAGRRALLVLDNCEHLVDAAARLADDLLGACPGLSVLTTSREALGIPGEALVPVGPLPAEDAARLVADRAAAARPGLVLDDGLVGDLVRRLDGMPLALELAAARLRTLSLAQVVARLDDRFALLTGGSRVALPRHQTLRAVVEWSWEALSPVEQAVARRLSVLVGGATVESAEAVCGVPDVVDPVASLVNKSLLAAVPEGDGVRFRMLETVRAYGAEQLDAAGERAATEAAHAAWCRALVDRLDPLLRGPGQLAALAELRAEQDGLVAALRRDLDAGRGDDAVHLAGRLAWFWLLTGQQVTAGRLLAEVAQLPARATPLRTACLTFAALAGTEETGWAGAMTALSAVVDVPAELGPAAQEPVVVVCWALSAVFVGRGDRLVALDDHPDPWVRAFVRAGRALAAENEGDYATLGTEVRAAREAFGALGDRWGRSLTASSLAQLAALDGDLAGAAALVREALECSDALGTSDDSPMLRTRLALLRATAGEPGPAGAELDAVVAELGPPAGPVLPFAEAGRAVVAVLAGEPDLAERWSAAAVTHLTGGAPGVVDQLAWFVRTVRAAVLAGRGDVAAATTELDLALGSGDAPRDMPAAATVVVGRALVAEAAGDPAGAARLLGMSEAVRGRPDLGDAFARGLRARLTAALGSAALEGAVAAGAAVGRAAALAELGPQTRRR